MHGAELTIVTPPQEQCHNAKDHTAYQEGYQPKKGTHRQPHFDMRSTGILYLHQLLIYAWRMHHQIKHLCTHPKAEQYE